MKRSLGSLVVVIALFLASCASFPRGGGLGVSLVNVLPRQASLFETSAELTLRLTNDAMEPFTLAGSAHRLFLNGSYVGRAVSSERLTIPQLGTATQTVIVYLENLTLVRKVAELGQAPAIAYRLESLLHPAEGGRFGSFKTSTTGELDLSAFTAGTPVSSR